jgi:DNA mismatch repair protein MLH3
VDEDHHYCNNNIMENTGRVSIRPLPANLSILIKSQVDLNTFLSCVLEVVKNSVDANASRVSITVDFKRLYFVVVDNGEGITPHDLELIGMPGHTSKFCLDNEHRTYGYRGESLNSISSQSTIVISSRSQEYSVTKSIRISYGERSKTYFSADKMASQGTSVTCQGLFSNFPVRQKQALSVLSVTLVEQLKRCLFPIAVAYPHITFSIHGPNNNRIFFIPGHQLNSIVPHHVELLRVIHGPSFISTWDCVRAKSKNTTIVATISHAPASSRASQYIGMRCNLQCSRKSLMCPSLTC